MRDRLLSPDLGPSSHKRGLKGVQGAKSPAGVWGTLSGGQVIPSFSFSSLAAVGGKESLKSAPMVPQSFTYIQTQ